MNLEKPQTIFVIGSKRDAVYPDVDPNLIIAANAAVSRAQDYFNRVPVIGVMSDQMFSDNVAKGEDGYLDDLRANVKGCRLDRMVFLKTLPESRYVVDPFRHVEASNVVYLSRWGCYRLLGRFVTLREVLRVVFESETPGSIIKSIYQAIRYGKFNPLEISTGMLALAYALDEFRPSLVYVIGVGMDPVASYFYSDRAVFNPFHVSRDVMFVRSLMRRGYGEKIVFTDSLFSANAAKWRETLSPKSP